MLRLDFDTAVKILNTELKKKKPAQFSSSWILENVPQVYRYTYKNLRTENEDIDWDRVTSSLDRKFQKRWVRYRCKKMKLYERQSEVDAVLSKLRDKLYVLLSPNDEKERRLQHRTIISLVRVGQKGNTLAQEEVIKWVTFITNDWMDKYPQIRRWKGYEDEIPNKIRTCIRLYRYTGSFIGYLFRTLEYSAFGKPPLVSLDDTMFGEKGRYLHEYVSMDESWRIYK
jgi:hypothetical protein